MNLLETLSNYDWTSIPAIIGYITTSLVSIFGVRERRLRNRKQRLDNIGMLESFLNEDIEQVHKVNDVLKYRLAEQEIELERLRTKLKNKEDGL